MPKNKNDHKKLEELLKKSKVADEFRIANAEKLWDILDSGQKNVYTKKKSKAIKALFRQYLEEIGYDY